MLRDICFYLRNKVFGKIPLRPLPYIPRPGAHVQEVAFYQRVLTSSLGEAERRRICLLVDVGCRNWSYLDALFAAFPNVALATGIEVDPGRRMTDLYRRGDLAQGFALAASKRGQFARVLLRDFMEVPFFPTPDTAYLFLYPFVSARPCRAWGLPSRFADFSGYLTRVSQILSPTSFVLSVHQGQWEVEVALKAYADSGLKITPPLLIPPSETGWPTPPPTYAIVARKNPALK